MLLSSVQRRSIYHQRHYRDPQSGVLKTGAGHGLALHYWASSTDMAIDNEEKVCFTGYVTSQGVKFRLPLSAVLFLDMVVCLLKRRVEGLATGPLADCSIIHARKTIFVLHPPSIYFSTYESRTYFFPLRDASYLQTIKN